SGPGYGARSANDVAAFGDVEGRSSSAPLHLKFHGAYTALLSLARPYAVLGAIHSFWQYLGKPRPSNPAPGRPREP
ncbi:MAG: hypothetical protein RL033_6665, partial [Pseudomonadota bacterium]